MKPYITLITISLILALSNLGFITAYIKEKYGDFSLSPGETYNVNIPFQSPSLNPKVCGYATYTNGTPVADINISITYNGKDEIIGNNVTDKEGYYCIVLPEVSGSSDSYDIYVSWNKTNLTLGSNDYTLNFTTEKEVYSKENDKYVIVYGTIENEDARIENGRISVEIKYYNGESWLSISDLGKFFVNIESKEKYAIPNKNDDINITWEIPEDAEVGRYKFYIKTSFNAKERYKYVYFNITE